MILLSLIEIQNGTPNIVLTIVIKKFASHCRPVLIDWSLDNVITGLDFSPNGELTATIDLVGVCLISDVNTDSCRFHMNMEMKNEYGYGK